MYDLKPRLTDGEVILIDGATGTELEVLGVPTIENGWCALASLTDPDAVKRVHTVNIEAGAEVIIANTFVCSRHVLDRAGHGDQFEVLNTLGVELAIEARNAAVGQLSEGRSVAVAGSISTTEQGGVAQPIEVSRVNFTDQVELQVKAGADLFILEMMRDLEQTQAILDAIRPTGVPVWVGYSCIVRDGEPWLFNGEVRLVDALAAIAGQPIDLVAIMHTEVDDIDSCVDVAVQQWEGPVGVYAHTGSWAPPNWIFTGTISVEDYTRACLRWVDRGVQVIGGCCGIGPAHIRHLRDNLPRRIPSRD